MKRPKSKKQSPQAPAAAPFKARLAAWAPPALIAAAAIAAFLPALGNDFVNWDDNKNLIENFNYRGLGPSQLLWMFRDSFGFMGNYEPVHWLSLGLSYALWGMRPMGYHLQALCLHAAAAGAFYFASLRLLEAAFGEAASKDPAGLRLCAAAAALLFGLHPLRVEGVAWVSGQHYAEAGLLWLLALLACLKALRESDAGRPAWRWHVLACAAYALSLLTLPIGMTFPAALVLLDLYPLRRWRPLEDGLGPRTRALALEKAPYAALAVLGAAVGFWAKKSGGFLISVSRVGPLSRLAIASYGLAYYLAQTLWPSGLYPDHELGRFVSAAAPAFLAADALLLLILGLAAFALIKRHPAGPAAWAYYALSLLPVLGLTQSGEQLVADRYSYLACLSWPLLAAGGLLSLRLSPEESRRRLFLPGLALATCAAAALAGQTWSYTRVWRNSETLWTHALSKDPLLGRGNNNLGNALAQKGLLDEAITHYEAALKLNPEGADTHHNLGNALALKGRLEEAVVHYRRAIELQPGHVKALNGLGNALRQQGKVDEAAAQFRVALQIDPGNFASHNNLGIALAYAGRRDEAESEFREALRLNPGFAQAEKNLRYLLDKKAGGPEAAPASK